MFLHVVGQKNRIAVNKIAVALHGYNMVLAVILQRHKISEQGSLAHNEFCVAVVSGVQKPDQRLDVRGGKGSRSAYGNAVRCAPSVRLVNALRLGSACAVDEEIFNLAGDCFRKHINDPAFKRRNAHCHNGIGNLNQLHDLVPAQCNGGKGVGGGRDCGIFGMDRRVVVRAFDNELHRAFDVKKGNFIQHRRKFLYLADNLVCGLRRHNLRARAAGVRIRALLRVGKGKAAKVFQPRGTVFGRAEGIVRIGVILFLFSEGTDRNAAALRDIVKNAVALLCGGNQPGALFGKLLCFFLQRVDFLGFHSVAALFDLLLDSRKAGFNLFNSHCVKPPS